MERSRTQCCFAFVLSCSVQSGHSYNVDTKIITSIIVDSTVGLSVLHIRAISKRATVLGSLFINHRMRTDSANCGLSCHQCNAIIQPTYRLQNDEVPLLANIHTKFLQWVSNMYEMSLEHVKNLYRPFGAIAGSRPDFRQTSAVFWT